MDGQVTISLSAIFSLAGFILQAALTVAAIAFSHGQIRQRVDAVEERLKEIGSMEGWQQRLSTVEERVRGHDEQYRTVVRMESQIEGLSLEIKGLREDFRRVLDEIARTAQARMRAQ